jgi:hypothetical protein
MPVECSNQSNGPDGREGSLAKQWKCLTIHFVGANIRSTQPWLVIHVHRRGKGST